MNKRMKATVHPNNQRLRSFPSTPKDRKPQPASIPFPQILTTTSQKRGKEKKRERKKVNDRAGCNTYASPQVVTCPKLFVFCGVRMRSGETVDALLFSTDATRLAGFGVYNSLKEGEEENKI